MTFMFTIKLVNKDNFFFFGCCQTTSLLNTESAFLLGEVAAPRRFMKAFGVLIAMTSSPQGLQQAFRVTIRCDISDF
jgi:hypothetical protein